MDKPTKIVVFDTETTGLPDKNLPELHNDQPWVLQLGVVVLEGWEITERLNTIVLPAADALFHAEAVALHGITPEVAVAQGKPTFDVLKTFRHMCRGADIVACYNIKFDRRIMLTTAMRTDADEFTADPLWAEGTYEHCIMLQTQQHFGGGRMKLNQAYRRVFGRPLQNAHDAFADTIAATEVFRELCNVTDFNQDV